MGFIGRNEVKMIISQEQKTPLGGEIVKVVFSDDTEKLMTKKTYDAMLTLDVSDDTTARRLMSKKLTEDVLYIIHEYGLTINEYDYFIQALTGEVNDNFNRAVNIAWTGKDDGFVPGYNPMKEYSFIDINRIISENNAKHGTASE
jgi:hypothetical protein